MLSLFTSRLIPAYHSRVRSFVGVLGHTEIFIRWFLVGRPKRTPRSMVLKAVLRSIGYKVKRQVCRLTYILNLDLCSGDMPPYATTWIPTPYSVCLMGIIWVQLSRCWRSLPWNANSEIENFISGQTCLFKVRGLGGWVQLLRYCYDSFELIKLRRLVRFQLIWTLTALPKIHFEPVSLINHGLLGYGAVLLPYCLRERFSRFNQL
jgi:hypothetical protein